ncbi:DUF5677 domain-containing protein [Streptomyces rhizosphaericus]|uniref:Uncharacterized protein n=1 Tax=Streptomyces rhizosphaericus TaxID=114699 RepID=A0A6G4APF8_9ACTN|nr:DUF5677 domain-containing protein [Streptomyces rhizosphaericus]NEW75225.1 hypothetical protein [Streptomyces rhizosphaericus]
MDVNDLVLRLINERLHEIFSGRSDRPSKEEIREHFHPALDQVLDDLHRKESDFFNREIKKASKGAKEFQMKSLKVRKASLKKLGFALRALDDLTAYSELLNRRMVYFLRGWMDPSDHRQMPPLLGRKSEYFGGPMLKILLFLSMHARASSIAAEISHLVKGGYREGAQARARTLYELTIFLLILSTQEDASQCELAGRYYMSNLGEIRAQERFIRNIPKGYREERDQTISLAKQKWGADLFRPYGWAKPALPQVNGQIRFSDLERAVEMGEHRHIYLEMNHAIHAGAANLINRTNFDMATLNVVGPELDLYYASRVIKVAVHSLLLCTGEANRVVSSLTGNPGASLYLAPLKYLESIVHSSLES